MEKLSNPHARYPFKDMWCLPGGFVGYNEDLEDDLNTAKKKWVELPRYLNSPSTAKVSSSIIITFSIPDKLLF